MTSNTRLRIVVLGYIVRGPVGGLCWHHLQYVLGLACLGHDVYFFEDSGESASCYEPTRATAGTDPTYGLQFTARLFNQLGIGDRWTYYDWHTDRWFGPCATGAKEIARTADVLLNLSGRNPIRPWFDQIPVRAFVDTDPVFTQIEHLTDAAARDNAAKHNAFFSFGENIGTAVSAIPDDGFAWMPTRQPIVLACWPVTPAPRDGKFTSVMVWNSYMAVEYDGRTYGLKSHSFQPFLDLPQRAGPVFELVVGRSEAPRRLLADHGWLARDPAGYTSPWSYRRFIRGSKAEFAIAKHAYVVSRSGWFSERTAAYLASGRPALVQDAGWSSAATRGLGVVPFSSPDEALAGIREINGNYDRHCRAARRIADECFGSESVLRSLVERATAGRDAQIATVPSQRAQAAGG